MMPDIYWKFIGRWFWLLALGLVLGMVVGYMYRAFGPIEVALWPQPSLKLAGLAEPRPVLYRSSVDIYLKDSLPSMSGVGGSAPRSLEDQAEILASEAKTQGLLDTLARELPDQFQVGVPELSRMLTVKSASSAPSVRFAAVSDNEEVAEAMVGRAASIFVDQVMANEEATLAELRQNRQKQLQELQEALDQAEAERRQIRDRILARAGEEFTLAQTEHLQALTAEIQEVKALLANVQDEQEKSLRADLEAILSRIETAEASQAKALSTETIAVLGRVRRAPARSEYAVADARVSAYSAIIRSLAAKIVSLELNARATMPGGEDEVRARIALENARQDLIIVRETRAKDLRAAQETLEDKEEAYIDLIEASYGNALSREDIYKPLKEQTGYDERLIPDTVKDAYRSLLDAKSDFEIANALAATAIADAEDSVAKAEATLRNARRGLTDTLKGDEAITIEIKRLQGQLQQAQEALDQAVAERRQLREQLTSLADKEFTLSQSARLEALTREVKGARALLARTEDEQETALRNALETALARIEEAEVSQSKALASAIDKALASLSPTMGTDEYTAVNARVTAYRTEIGKLTPWLASVQAAFMASPEKYFGVAEPTKPSVVSQAGGLRKRDILVRGGGVGLIVAWFVAGILEIRERWRRRSKQAVAVGDD